MQQAIDVLLVYQDYLVIRNEPRSPFDDHLTLAAVSRLRPGRVFGAVGRVLAGIREGQDIWRRYEALSELSDGQLARRGLTRDQIPQAAVRGF
jgi:uncharacterized protein YjiS (DUF1127 family)